MKDPEDPVVVFGGDADTVVLDEDTNFRTCGFGTNADARGDSRGDELESIGNHVVEDQSEKYWIGNNLRKG